jgi:hypothetical protein
MKAKLTKRLLKQKGAEARRADQAKARYAKERGLHPITLKPLSTP